MTRMSCMEGRRGRLSAVCLRSRDLLQYIARIADDKLRHTLEFLYIVIQSVNVPCYVLWRSVTCHEWCNQREGGIGSLRPLLVFVVVSRKHGYVVGLVPIRNRKSITAFLQKLAWRQKVR